MTCYESLRVVRARDTVALAEEFLTSSEVAASPARVRQVRAEIEETGTYRHTAAELRTGALMAWRNSARCVGRLHAPALTVLDQRHLRTARQVAEACVEHLRHSTNGGGLRPALTVFAPRGPGGEPCLRLWNRQLLNYADDPVNEALVAALEPHGWRPSGARFERLPLVVQEPGRPPLLHPLPDDAVLEVDITHPDLPWFAGLGIRWYANPAISDMCLLIGGVEYPAAPFSGWFMVTEIGTRDLGDTARYNLLPVVAGRLGLDTARNDTLWRDRAVTELNCAVLHSFRAAGVRIVDHHTASEQMVRHLERERCSGREVPADWAWLVPPTAGSTTELFHRTFPAPDPALTPTFCYQPPAWTG
ncbi:nitric oxide synthase oxygenase [Streptomyces sp. NPDC005805]|uniref:nitric oxide synthase oxygenase n=1 Tax=Streptomyces sp. NPDC005805 TaxID=3157068 RepID=UPI0033E6A803